MIGRYFEVGCELGQGALSTEALQSIHTRIELQRADALAHERSRNTERMGIKLVHNAIIARKTTDSEDTMLPEGGQGHLRSVAEVSPARHWIDHLGLAAEGIRIDRTLVLTKEADDRCDMCGDPRIDPEEARDRGKWRQSSPFHLASRKLAARRVCPRVRSRDRHQPVERILCSQFTEGPSIGCPFPWRAL